MSHFGPKTLKTQGSGESSGFLSDILGAMEKRGRTPVWLWMNLLSLDAPVVALVWQWFLARCYPSVLLPAGQVVLGLTVWAIYLGDRLLDVRHPVAGVETRRHTFYREHGAIARWLLISVLSADVLVTFLWLRPAVFVNGLLVAAGVTVYLGAFPIGRIQGVWKQAAAAFLFAIGVFLIAWTGTAQPLRTLGWPAAAFYVLCIENLLLIEGWERDHGIARGWIWMAVFSVLCLVMRDSPWYLAIAASSAGLSALAFWGGRLSQDARRVLADAVLLSPLLFP